MFVKNHNRFSTQYPKCKTKQNHCNTSEPVLTHTCEEPFLFLTGNKERRKTKIDKQFPVTGYR